MSSKTLHDSRNGPCPDGNNRPPWGWPEASAWIRMLFEYIITVGMIDQLSRILEVARPQPRIRETRSI